MKKKSYQLIFRRGLKKTKSRFLSIFLIVFIGTSFFAGLRNTPITMQLSMNNYIQSHKFADLTLISTLGFSQSDVEFINTIEGVNRAVGTYRCDGQMNYNQHDYSITMHSQSNNFHSPDILKGRNIENEGECLVDASFLGEELIDQTITVTTENGTKVLKVVGIVNDVRYISQLLRGSNSMTKVENEAFIIVSEQDMISLATIDELCSLRNVETLYNEILVEYTMSSSLNMFSDMYHQATQLTQSRITDQMQNRLIEVENEILSRYNQQLDEAKAKYKQGLTEYESNKEQFELTTNEAKIKLIEAKLQLAENKKKLLQSSTQLNNASKETTQQINELNNTIEQYQQQIHQFELSNQNQQIDTSLNTDQINTSDTQTQIDDLKNSVNDMLEEIQAKINGLNQLVSANIELNEANNTLESAQLEIEKNEAILENTIITTNKELAQVKEQLDQAKEQINQGEQEITLLPKATLYSLGINENAGLVSFNNDIESMDALSKIFPLMFFLVAALVSLTTMTRMVEEQRQQSGVLRALGYSKKDIYMLYIKYVLLATLIASIFGIIFGTQFFTRIIYFLYTSLMYNVNAPVVVSMTKNIIPLTLVISVAITLVVTLFILFEELNSLPAVLLRPKPPKLGKRIVLEKFPSLWKKFSFNQKVTIRNMFRYKKRFFMSIVGIAGCSALIVTGFGIKNSIQQIIPLQFEQIWTYDGMMSIHQEAIQQDEIDLVTYLTKQNNIQEVSLIQSQSVIINSSSVVKDLTANLQVLSDSQTDLIHFFDENKSPILLEGNGVILSQKASELLNLKKGDLLKIEMNDQSFEIEVAGVCQNYYGHYIYISKNNYETLTNQKVSYNQVIFKMKSDTTNDEQSLSELMINDSYISHITFTSTLNENFNQMIQSIDVVVVIIIVFAALLAFIVLYNLTNINIQERMNEIATIKVLGFYPKEVNQYIFRENTLLSLIGASFGLVFGKILHYFVISTVEIEATMFYRQLNFSSYLIAFILTMVFSEVINLMMRRTLTKINMIESLKSVE